MPKSSTFYLRLGAVPEGVAPHLFLALQHSSKSWSVGHFTVNVIVSQSAETISKQAALPTKHAHFARGLEGRHRIGSLVHGKDKWWCLAPMPDWAVDAVKDIARGGRSSTHQLEWVPSTYDDDEIVFAEAADDLTVDVRRLLELASARRA